MTMCIYFGTIRLILILWTSICLQDAQAIRKPFEVVEKCPFNESEWKMRAANVTCNGFESYHCLLTEGGVSLREQCTETSLITSGFCPIFTNDGYLQWSPCKDVACPASSYRSDEVYQYQICYRKTDNPNEEYIEHGSKDKGSVTGVTTITVIVLLSFCFIVVVVLVVFYKRNQFGFKDKVQYCFTDAERRGNIPCQAEPLLQQGTKLNPDCKVEKGIVITNNITNALTIMNLRNVVILKGAIGCGKTHALKAIQNHFQENGLETVWVESEYVKGEISHEKPTILLCDNLFGEFGNSVFSQDAVDTTEKALEKIESSKLKTKVVIGIHTHVYDEVNKSLKLNFLHKEDITVEMDNLSEEETLLIFKEQLKKGHCETDSNCGFKSIGFQSVLDRLSRNQGHIGRPFLSLMYCNQHELFYDEAFSVNPVHAMVKFFQKVGQDCHQLYAYLVYLMCVQEHNDEEGLQQWANNISADVTLQALEKMVVSPPIKCIQAVNRKVTIAHELFSVVLFKSVAETTVLSQLYLHVIQQCKVDIIIQILRPDRNCQSDIFCEFVDVNKSVLHRQVGKTCVFRLARKYNILEVDHPLMTIEFVKEKYPKYLNQEPVLYTWSQWLSPTPILQYLGY